MKLKNKIIFVITFVLLLLSLTIWKYTQSYDTYNCIVKYKYQNDDEYYIIYSNPDGNEIPIEVNLSFWTNIEVGNTIWINYNDLNEKIK